MDEGLAHCSDLVYGERDHPQHGERRDETQGTPRSHGDRLKDDQQRLSESKRDYDNTEKGRHPRHRAPPTLIAHEPYERFNCVCDGPESSVGDRERL